MYQQIHKSKIYVGKNIIDGTSVCVTSGKKARRLLTSIPTLLPEYT